MATRKANDNAPSAGYLDLKRQYEELEQRIAEERNRMRPEVIAHIKASMVEYDIGVKDLVGASGKIRRKRRTRAEIEADNAAGAQ